MADSKLIACIGEELECPVCAEYFKDARFLQCMHTFCLGCLEKCEKTYGRGGKSSMICPLCRKVTHLGKDGVGDLKTDFMSNKLVTRLTEGIEERQKAAGLTENTGVKCQSCSDGCVSAYCLSCSHFICGGCQSLHAKLGAMRTHEVIPLKDLRKGNVTVVRRQEKKQFCCLHKLDRDCFCYTCTMYVCELCVLCDHSDHEYMEYEHNTDDKHKQEDPKREAVRRTVEQIAKKSRDLGGKKKSVKRLRANVKRRFGEMRHQVQSTCEIRIRTVARLMKERSGELEKELDANEEVVLGKLASVDENIGCTESRILEAKSIGENAIKDGRHAEIAFVHDYLQCVNSGLVEEDSNTVILKQIEQYSTGVHLHPCSNEDDVKTLALIGHISHPDTWSLVKACQLPYEDVDVRAIHFDSSRGLFVACSAGTIDTINRNGIQTHTENLEIAQDICDMAITVDGTCSYILDGNNQLCMFRQSNWTERNVIDIQQVDGESTLSCVAVDHKGNVVVGDQTTKSIYGCSSFNFQNITQISPIQMTFTGNGDLVVVSRNDWTVEDECIQPACSGVAVRVFGSGDSWGNIIPQNNWQAAAVTSCPDKKFEADGTFYGLGIYMTEDGRQLASLAEYDKFGQQKDSVFQDIDLLIDITRGCCPRIAVDSQNSTLAVYTGREVHLYRKACIALGNINDDD